MPKIRYEDICDEVTQQPMMIPVKVDGKWRDFLNLTVDEQETLTHQVKIEDDQVIYVGAENIKKAKDIQTFFTFLNDTLLSTIVGENRTDRIDADSVDAKKVEDLLILGANLHSVDRAGRTPLHAAAERGSVEIVQLLIDAGADASLVDSAGHTPLHLALEGQRQEASIALIKANPDTLNTIDEFGRKPIHVAAEKGDLKFFQAIAAQEGVSIDVKDSQGKTVLDYAVEKGEQTDLVDFLIARSAANGDKEAVSQALSQLHPMKADASWRLWRKMKSEIINRHLPPEEHSERLKSAFALFLKNELRTGQYKSTGIDTIKDIFGESFDLYDDNHFLKRVGEVVNEGSGSLRRTIARTLTNSDVVILYANVAKELTAMQIYPSRESVIFPPKKEQSMASTIARPLEKDVQDSPEVKIMRECLGEMKMRFNGSVLSFIPVEDSNRDRVEAIRFALRGLEVDHLDASQVKENYRQVQKNVNQLVVQKEDTLLQRRGSTAESPVALYQQAKDLINTTEGKLKDLASPSEGGPNV